VAALPNSTPAITRDPKKLIELAGISLKDSDYVMAQIYLRLADLRIDAAIHGCTIGTISDTKFYQKAKRIIRKHFPNA
jgi:hypothetical protein